jgi:hypothetical protein
MAELDHTIVSIRFVGQDLDPKRLGEMLGFTEPGTTKSIIKRLKNGTVVWSISFENNDAFTVEEKINVILARFTKNISAWAQATTNAKAEIFCGVFLDQWNQGFSLTPYLMKELSNRNLEIGFDIYSPIDSWDSRLFSRLRGLSHRKI